MGQQPAGAEKGQYPFAEPERLLHMRLPGQDEVVEAEVVVFGDPFGDLLVAADERSTGTAADETEPSPQVRAHHEVLAATSVQRGHALLSGGLGARELSLRDLDHVLGHRIEQAIRLRPRSLRGRHGR